MCPPKSTPCVTNRRADGKRHEAAQNGFSYGETYWLALPQGEDWFEFSVAPVHAVSTESRSVRVKLRIAGNRTTDADNV